MQPITLASTLSLTLTVACGPSTSTDTSTTQSETSVGASSADSADSADSASSAGSIGSTGSTGSTSGGGLLPEGCACREIPDDTFTCDDRAPTECQGGSLCPEIVGICPRPNPDLYACDIEYEYDEQALACALEALRDRTPGKITTETENSICGLEGCGSDQTEITIVPGERAVVRACTANPITAESSDSTLRELSPPAFFDECLALPTTNERYRCMFDGLQSTATLCG